MRWLIPLAFAACTTHDPVDDFVGRWTYYDATVTTTCSNGAPQMKDLVGGFELARTGTGDEIAIDIASQYTWAVALSGSCTPTFTVTETQADLVPQLPCTLATTSGDVELTYTFYELRLANVNAPDLAPMTPGLLVDFEADVSNGNGSCQVVANPTAIIAP